MAGDKLAAALAELMIDSPDHHIPTAHRRKDRPCALMRPSCSTAPAARRVRPVPSSRQRSPATKVFVTVDSGEIDIDDAEVSFPPTSPRR